MSFNDYFALAEKPGIVLVAAAERLMDAITAPNADIACRGFERQWDWIEPDDRVRWHAEDLMQTVAALLDDEKISSARRHRLEAEYAAAREMLGPEPSWNERLPRKLQPAFVPVRAWEGLGSIGPGCTSRYIDDEEHPDECSEVDWISGTLEFTERTLPDWHSVKTVFVGLEMERATAMDLLAPNWKRSVNSTSREPNLPEPTLAAWWESLSPEEKMKDRDREIWPMCVEAHPGFTVTVRRVRNLPPKRGQGRPAKYATRHERPLS